MRVSSKFDTPLYGPKPSRKILLFNFYVAQTLCITCMETIIVNSILNAFLVLLTVKNIRIA